MSRKIEKLEEVKEERCKETLRETARQNHKEENEIQKCSLHMRKSGASVDYIFVFHFLTLTLLDVAVRVFHPSLRNTDIRVHLFDSSMQVDAP